MITRYLTGLLALSATAIALTGCGSGGESSGEAFAQTTMPIAKYAHKTDLICSEASYEQVALAGTVLQKHPNTREVDLVIPAAVPPIEKEIEELHELGLPKGHEEEAEVFVGEMEAALRALKAKPSGALSQENNPFQKANELGKKLGLGDCTRNP